MPIPEGSEWSLQGGNFFISLESKANKRMFNAQGGFPTSVTAVKSLLDAMAAPEGGQNKPKIRAGRVLCPSVSPKGAPGAFPHLRHIPPSASPKSHPAAPLQHSASPPVHKKDFLSLLGWIPHPQPLQLPPFVPGEPPKPNPLQGCCPQLPQLSPPGPQGEEESGMALPRCVAQPSKSRSLNC